MCLQGRDLIDVTVSDHLKLLFDTFKELIVTIIISVRGLGVSRQVSLPVRLSCSPLWSAYQVEGGLVVWGVPVVWLRGASSRGTSSAVFQTLFLQFSYK